MKKVAIILLSIIALFACSDDVFVEKYPEPTIDFLPSAGMLLRGVNTTENLRYFRVWGVNIDDAGAVKYVFDGAPVKLADGAWNYGDKKYWPLEGNVDFLAVYPAHPDADTIMDPRTNTPCSAIFHTMSDTQREVRFKALYNGKDSTYVAMMPDLIYAVAEDQVKQESDVILKFRHAMAQVKFEIKNENPRWNIYFRPDSAVVLCNIRSRGSYTLPSKSTTEDGSRGTWVINEDQHQHFTVLTGSDVFVEGMIPANEHGYIRPAWKEENINAPFMKNGEPAMVLPCQVPEWDVKTTTPKVATADDQHGAYFMLWCRVESVQNGETFTIWGNVDAQPTDDDYYMPVYVPLTVNWQEGYCYKYTLALGRGLGYNADGTHAAVPLSFSTSVEEFIKDADLNVEFQEQN